MISRIRQIVTHPAVKVAYLALLLAAAAYYLFRWGDRVLDLLSQARPAWVGAALVVSYLSALLYSYIQYYIYRNLRAQPTYWSVFRIVTLSQLGKYLPGKVFFVGNFYLFSREAGIGNLQIGASFAISMALWMLTASLCGLPALGLLEPGLRYSVLILPLLLAVLIHPRFLGWLLQAIQRLGSRVRGAPAADIEFPAAKAGDSAEPPQIPLDELGIAFYLRAALLYLATWALAGLGLYCCLAALGPVELDIYPLALASIALGTVAGFVALFAPVGLGVREGIGALILAPVVGAEVALLALLLLRGVTVTVDLSLALVSMAAGSRLRATG